MHASTRLGRTVALTASAGLVSVLAMLPSGSAFALVTGSFAASGSASSSPTSGNTCTLTAGNSSPTSSTHAVVGGKVSASVSLNATFKSNTDVNDVTNVSGHYTGVVNVKKSHGDLSRLTMTGTGSATIQRAEGSASHCRTTAELAAVIQPMSFTESHSGWFLAHRSGTSKSQLVVVELVNASAGGALVEEYEGGAGSANERAFAGPGTFQAVAAVGATSGGALLKTANQTSFSVQFYRAGAAPSGTSGSGKAFVRFPGSVQCGSHSATLTWTSKAGQVAGASFLVNGAKKASVSHPHAGDHVTLHHLSSTADNKIAANLSLKGGGHASASRVYLPCKG